MSVVLSKVFQLATQIITLFLETTNILQYSVEMLYAYNSHVITQNSKKDMYSRVKIEN